MLNTEPSSTALDLDVLCNTRRTKKCFVAAIFCKMILVRINLILASCLSLWLENIVSCFSILFQLCSCSGETDMLEVPKMVEKLDLEGQKGRLTSDMANSFVLTSLEVLLVFCLSMENHQGL